MTPDTVVQGRQCTLCSRHIGHLTNLLPRLRELFGNAEERRRTPRAATTYPQPCPGRHRPNRFVEREGLGNGTPDKESGVTRGLRFPPDRPAAKKRLHLRSKTESTTVGGIIQRFDPNPVAGQE